MHLTDFYVHFRAIFLHAHCATLQKHAWKQVFFSDFPGLCKIQICFKTISQLSCANNLGSSSSGIAWHKPTLISPLSVDIWPLPGLSNSTQPWSGIPCLAWSYHLMEFPSLSLFSSESEMWARHQVGLFRPKNPYIHSLYARLWPGKGWSLPISEKTTLVNVSSCLLFELGDLDWTSFRKTLFCLLIGPQLDFI